MCYQSSDNESITKYYNLDFICFCVNVNSYFSLAEKTVTASFFLYNHIDLRRQSAAEGGLFWNVWKGIKDLWLHNWIELQIAQFQDRNSNVKFLDMCPFEVVTSLSSVLKHSQHWSSRNVFWGLFFICLFFPQTHANQLLLYCWIRKLDWEVWHIQPV